MLYEVITFGRILLLVAVFSPRGKTAHVAWLSIVALVITGMISLAGWNEPQSYNFV